MVNKGIYKKNWFAEIEFDKYIFILGIYVLLREWFMVNINLGFIHMQAGIRLFGRKDSDGVDLSDTYDNEDGE